jgi:hypothetical protein
MPDNMIPDENDLDKVNLPPVTEPEPMVPEAGTEPGLGPAYAAEEAPAEVPPEEAAAVAIPQVTNIYQLIPIAMEQRRHLQIIYTSVHTGLTKTYAGEPYEIKDGFLWLYDIEADRIKSLYLSNIADIQLLETTFIPRWS